MRHIEIVEFPSNLGLIEPSPGKQPGVVRLPGWLKQHGFYDIINPQGIHHLEPPAYSMLVDKDSGVRNANAISAYASQQAALLLPIIRKGYFVLAIGGDCSILIGNTLALKQVGQFGLFFLDGHTDYGWPQLSQTAGAAGMDLAIVTGTGHDKLSNIQGLKPYILESNTWAVGNRDFDPAYVKVIEDSGINYFDLNKLRSTGLEKCVGGFLQMNLQRKLNGFWLHLDVDVLDDALMPAVDSREKGGMTYEELDQVLQMLLKSRFCMGMEITILDPDLDPGGTYTKEFVQRVGQIIVASLGQESQ